MARKKRKKREQYEFQVPEFDETGYLRREIEGAKAAMVTLVYAFLVALASYSLTLVGQAALGGLLGFVALYGLRYVYPRVGLDMAQFDWKLWAGNGAIHLFAWFAFWVLLLNPPFLDIAAPVIHSATVPGGIPPDPGPGGVILLSLGGNTSFPILAIVTDNQRLVDVQIRVVDLGSDDEQGGSMTPTGERAEFRYMVLNVSPGRNYQVAIEAFDQAARVSTPFTFTVGTS